jgi:WhiB family redox-sensing transcriptional regulator
MDWRDKAACLTADPELFFPVGNTGPAVDQIDKAKSVCGRCTVTETCLQYALETSQDSGVWGGLSEDERRALKRRAARARRASCPLSTAPTTTPAPEGAGFVVRGAGRAKPG